MAESEQSVDAGLAEWRDEVMTAEDPSPEPEAPTEAAEADQAPPDAEEPDTTAQGETEAPPADAPPADGEETPAEPTDTGTSEDGTPADEPDATEPSAPTEPQEQTEDAPQPFVARVDGQDVPIQGAFEQRGHVIMSREAWERQVRPKLVTDRMALIRQGETRGHQKAMADVESSHPLVQRAKLILGQIEELKKGGPEAVQSWAAQFVEQLPVLEAQAEAQVWRERAETGAQAERARTEQQTTAETEANKERTLRGYIQSVLDSPDVKPLGLDAGRIFEQLRYDRRLYQVADRDYPESGIREGQEALNAELFYDVIGREANAAKQAAQRKEEAKTRAKQNKAALNDKPKVAPVVAPAGAGQGNAAKNEKEPESLDEWRDSLFR